ncbi:MAG TPA: hypothetical protein VFW46_05995 [Stellaceae bacterium]|nr:hypothetical protein [Stellaceae bacterium]
MTLRNLIGRSGVTLAAAAMIGVVGMTATPKPAEALGTGAAVGLGLGAFALGTAVGAAANPYYPNGYYYGPGYYYPPAPAYYPYSPRQCWDGYYGRYYAC